MTGPNKDLITMKYFLLRFSPATKNHCSKFLFCTVGGDIGSDHGFWPKISGFLFKIGLFDAFMESFLSSSLPIM